MAHSDRCFGTWRKSQLGGTPDGRIRIDEHHSDKITGWHFDSSKPIEGTCTGSVQNFNRMDDKGQKVNYKNGVITLSGTKFKIQGKFDRMPKNLKRSAAAGKKKKMLADDWTAEKPT